MIKKRIMWIDALKGLAITLVVVGHVCDGYLKANFFTDNSSFLNFIFNFIYSFHMPLFFFISGYLFYISYIKENKIDIKKFKIQLLNLVYIYLIFSIIQWIAKYFFNEYVNTSVSILDLVNILIRPMAPYWYVYDLILFYIAMLIVNKIKNKKIFCIGIIFLDIILVQFDLIPFFENKLYYFIFFYCGIILTDVLKSKSWILLLIPSILLNIIYSIGLLDENINQFVKFIVSISMIIGLIGLFKNVFTNISDTNILCHIGKYNLEIYLFHCYITAGNRVFLKFLNINNFYLNFFINCILGVLIPIIISIILRKIKIYDYVFKPATFLKKKKQYNI